MATPFGGSADEEEVREEGEEAVASGTFEQHDLVDDLSAQAGEEEGAAEGFDAKAKKLREELGEARREKQEYMDGWQRSKADYVNLLKRFETESRGAKQAGVVKAVEALLPAFDALERSKEHGDLPEGFQAIAKQLESAFASLGLAEIGQVGEQFDPTLHEALGQDAVTEEKQDDIITSILEKGWKIGDTIIRPAKVKVGKYD